MQTLNSIATAIVVFLVAIAGGIYVQQHGFEFTDIREAATEIVTDNTPSTRSNVVWPPRVGQEFPDLNLQDLSGERVQLSKYRGQVIVLEPIGLSCKGCQAFAGGHIVGGFGGMRPQPELKSLTEYVREYGGGITLSDDRIVSIQILFYGPSGHRAPSLSQARDWATHFQRFSPDTVFLLADQSMVCTETRKMIPGCQLIDREFILRCDAGNPPREDLFRTLIPMIKTLL